MHPALNHQKDLSQAGDAPRYVRPVARILEQGPAAAAMGLCVMLSGCDGPVPPVNVSPDPQGSTTGWPGREARGRQADFLNQIRRADPEFRTIERALLNEQNELGLVLDRSVELEKIPALMRLMLTKMAAQFPGEDLTVIAYTPSNPPQRVGTARLDARTRGMTWTTE